MCSESASVANKIANIQVVEECSAKPHEKVG